MPRWSLGPAGLRLAKRLVERVTQDRSVVRAHLESEMRERPAPVRAGFQRLVHQRRRVSGPGPSRLVPPCTAVPFSPEPSFVVQVVHHRHHGGIGQGPVTAQLVEDLPDKRRTAPFPQPVHDYCFQLTESSHPALPDMSSQRLTALSTITHRVSQRFSSGPHLLLPQDERSISTTRDSRYVCFHG